MEEKRMNKKELLELIKSIKIDKEEFIVLSSGALVLRGIMDSAGDLDILVTQKGFEQLKENYDLKEKKECNNSYIVNEKIECILNDNEDRKEKMGDYYIQDINQYLEFLKESNREKDKLRIPIVEKYIEDRKNEE